MSSPFAHMAAAQRLLVFVGDGGVGKTSTAAATALACARRGRRTAVLTIDPAPRLGDALGVGALDESPHAIPVDGPGSLVAMRLDAKRTFDRLVERLAPSAESAATLLANPLYQTLSGSLGGSEAYMAFQRIYELAEDEDYDLVIVDTPPAAHAAELLSAPLRLTALLETGATAILANPALLLARAGSRFARAGLAAVLAVLERLTGGALRSQISDFILHFESVLEGLSERADTVDRLLRRSDTAFVQVTRPRLPDVVAAGNLRASLAARQLSVAAIIVNRLTPQPLEDRTISRRVRIAGAPAGTLEAVAIIEAELDALREAEAAAIEAVYQRLDAGDGSAPLVVELVSLEHDIGRREDLLALAGALFGPHGNDLQRARRAAESAS